MLKKKLRKAFKNFYTLSKTAHKTYVLVFCELFYWIVFRKGNFGYYMDYKLYLKGQKLADYVTAGEFHRIEKRLNSPEYYPILEDKYFFSKVLESSSLRSPKNLYLIDNLGIFNLESSLYIAEEEFLQREFDGFCKIFNGFGGKMIYQIEVVRGNLLINKQSISFSDFLKLIGHNKFLVQERIIQHPEMNALNPSCVNTMRMLTIRTGQTIHLYMDYLKIGINDNFVDNGLYGNIMIGIREGGRLMENACSGALDSPSFVMDRHPQTNVIFKDFTIPFYLESVVMAKSLHQLFQQFFMIGWDIGITPEGPIVIEANNISTLFPFQLLYGGLNSSFNKMAESYEKHI